MKHIITYINEKLHLTAKYTCQPESKDELKQIIVDRIEKEGNDCDLNDIDTSKITDMSNLFDASYPSVTSKKFKPFKGDISQWNVSNVTNMKYMFCGCVEFNCDLSMWNVSKVEDMAFMFYGCDKFKQNIDDWNVSNVKYMRYAFLSCPTRPTWYNMYE